MKCDWFSEPIRHIPRGVCLFMLQKLKDKWKHRKWTIYLFYDGVLIKKLKIDENTKPEKETYFIKVYGHKHIFGKNIISLVVNPVRVLKTDEKHKKTYWGVKDEIGVEVK